MDNTQQTKSNSMVLAVAYLTFGITYTIIPGLLMSATIGSFVSHMPYLLTIIGGIAAIVLGIREFKLNEPDPKGKAIASLFFGCIGIIIYVIMYKMTETFIQQTGEGAIGGFGLLFSSPIPIGFGVLGLISGIIVLKSDKRNLAIVGIILSIISVAFPIYIISNLLFL